MTQHTAPVDLNGFLINLNDWTPTVAELLATKEALSLTKEHWAIVIFLRQYYLQHHKTPGQRTLVKHLGDILNDPNKGNSLYLHKLFPKAPMRQACKIAGLPKPPHCL